MNLPKNWPLDFPASERFDAHRLAEAGALDRAYAEAEAFHARRAAEAERERSRARAEAFARLEPGSPEWLALDAQCAAEDEAEGDDAGGEDWERIAGDRR